MTQSIYDEIEERWRALFAKMQRDPVSRGNFQKLLSEQETEARSATTEGLQPHLGILEFALEWLAYIHVALSKSDDIGPANKDCRAAWALTGAAVAYGLSIRSLCMGGFDTPARALLRTYLETLFLCIAVVHDRALGKAYMAAKEDADVKNFWHTSASPKKLHERIIAVEKRLGLGDDVIQEFTEWRRQEGYGRKLVTA